MNYLFLHLFSLQVIPLTGVYSTGVSETLPTESKIFDLKNFNTDILDDAI